MSQEVKYFRIGLFVVISATILAAALIFFGAGRVFEKRIYFETYVKGSVQGIDRGAPVKFRGVSIGQVNSVTFVFNEYPAVESSPSTNPSTNPAYNFVMIVMEVTQPVFPGMFDGNITDAVQHVVEKGLRVRIEPIGITGMNFLEMDFLDPKEFPPLPISWTPHDYYIPSAPGQLTSILDSVNRIMRDLQNLELGELGDELTSLLGNLNTAVTGADISGVSKDARRLMETLEVAVKEADFATLSKDAKALMESLDSTIKESDIQGLSASTRETMDDTRKSLAELQKILANIEPATRLNTDDINATLSNLRVMTDDLRVLSGDLRRYPSRLIWGGPPPPTNVFEDAAEDSPENAPGPLRNLRRR